MPCERSGAKEEHLQQVYPKKKKRALATKEESMPCPTSQPSDLTSISFLIASFGFLWRNSNSGGFFSMLALPSKNSSFFTEFRS